MNTVQDNRTEARKRQNSYDLLMSRFELGETYSREEVRQGLRELGLGRTAELGFLEYLFGDITWRQAFATDPVEVAKGSAREWFNLRAFHDVSGERIGPFSFFNLPDSWVYFEKVKSDGKRYKFTGGCQDF